MPKKKAPVTRAKPDSPSPPPETKRTLVVVRRGALAKRRQRELGDRFRVVTPGAALIGEQFGAVFFEGDYLGSYPVSLFDAWLDTIVAHRIDGPIHFGPAS